MGLPISSSHKVSILQYADDTILFGTYDFKEVAMLQSILYYFEAWSVLSVNFYKSSIVFLGGRKL